MDSPSEWRAAGRLHSWRGLPLYVRDSGGTGEPLLLLHGFPTSSWDWRHIWADLASRYRVVAFDYIGFGLSAKPRSGPYFIFAYADQAEAVLRELGIARPHILAHDLGDTVAQELLARGGYASCALLNGGVFPELHRARPAQKLLRSPVGPLVARLASRRTFDRNMQQIFGATPPSREELDGMWELASREHGTHNFDRIIDYIGERRLYRERWVAPLLAPQIPTCMINGHADPVSGRHVVDTLRRLAPGVEIFDLPGVGHYPQIETPSKVLGAYSSFRSKLL